MTGNKYLSFSVVEHLPEEAQDWQTIAIIESLIYVPDGVLDCPKEQDHTLFESD